MAQLGHDACIGAKAAIYDFLVAYVNILLRHPVLQILMQH